MIELELLGVNGDAIVMTSADGERFTLVIDDALRAAVRRDRLPVESVVPEPGTPVRPRDLQTLMRAGASAEEVAATTGLPLDHVRKYQGPVLAEREWAVSQARTCRVGWERDSPVLGDLVVDRLATRGVDDSLIEWDAVRQGRDPWEVTVTFVQGAEERQARWVLDLSTRAVTALDDESRWLTETSSPSRRPAVFDQDSQAPGASAGSAPAHPDRSTTDSPAPATSSAHSPAAAPVGRTAGSGRAGSARSAQSASQPSETDATDALLADLAGARGRRQELEIPEDTDAEGIDQVHAAEPNPDEEAAPARVVSMSEHLSAHRRARVGNHPAGTQLPAPEEADVTTRSGGSPRMPGPTPQSPASAPTAEVEQVGTQDALPDMPEASSPRPRRRNRRSVPSWDEIVFGARPE